MNRHMVAPNAEPLPTLDNAIAVRNTVNRLIDDVYSRKLDPKIASGLAPLLALQLRAIGTADVEQCVADLQRQLTEAIARQNSVPKIRPELKQSSGENGTSPQ